jgi:hypothetical protein
LKAPEAQDPRKPRTAQRPSCRSNPTSTAWRYVSSSASIR